MTGSFSYASFAPRDGHPGGWGVGRISGEVGPRLIDELIPLIPTQISDPVTLSAFPDRSDLARRLRRFAWLSAPQESRGVFFASSPAGQDASGRPGNVFTYVHVGSPGDLRSRDAVDLMLSPSIPAPFGKRKVEDATLPDLRAGFVAPSPMTRTVVDAFLDGAPADSAGGPGVLPTECSRVTPPTGPATRREILAELVTRLTDGHPVVLLADAVEGPLWVAALAGALPAELPGGRPFTWSTYERAAGVREILGHGASLVVVPLRDREKLPVLRGTTVLATDRLPSEAEFTAGTPPVPRSSTRSTTPTPTRTSVPAAFTVSDPSPAEAPAAAPTTAGSMTNPFEAVSVGRHSQATGPAPAPDPLPDPHLHRALVRLTDADVDFIREAALPSWEIIVNRLPSDVYKVEDYRRNWERRELTDHRNYLLLDPADELGWTVRIRLLALASYGAVPGAPQSGDPGPFEEWPLTVLGPHTVAELVKVTADYTLDHGYADNREPDFHLFRDRKVQEMARKVFLRRTQVRPVQGTTVRR